MYFKLLTQLSILMGNMMSVHSVEGFPRPEIFPSQFVDQIPGKLCCRFSERYTILRLYGKGCGVSKFNSTDDICCIFSTVERKLRGAKYTCILYIENYIEMTVEYIDVLYPPSFEEVTKILLNDTNNQVLICPVKSGNPANHTFALVWEHLTLFGEHIRYLNGTDDGTLHMPWVDIDTMPYNETLWYQDAGIYVCRVQNGIADKYGNVVQDGHISVKYAGPPVILDKVKQSRPDSYDEPYSNVGINIYSKSVLTCAILTYITISKAEKYYSAPDAKQNFTTSFHGKMIQLEVYRIHIPYKVDGEQLYKLTVCNEFGNTSTLFVALAETKESLRMDRIPIIYPVLAILVVLVATLCIVFWV